MSNIMRVKNDHATKRSERIVLDYCAQGGMVLLVTDDDGFARMVRATLAGIRADVKAGYRETADYDEAVTFANRIVDRLNVPLVLFLEQRIHKISCLKTLKVLRTFYAQRVRLLVAGGEMSAEQMRRAREAGADSCITKPISANAIIEKIAYAVRPNNQLGVLLDRAAELIAAGDLQQAGRVAAKAMEIKPDSLKGHLLLGDVARQSGDFAAAEKHYLAACRAEKLYVEPLQKLVDLCAETGETTRRLAYLARLDSLSPLNFERKVELGETYLAKGDDQKAKGCFEEARRVVTRVASDMVSESLMEIAHKIGEKDQETALRFVTEALAAKGDELSRSDLWMFNDRGILLRRQGLWDQAVANYERALHIAPDDPGLLYNMGVAHAEGKQYDQALEYFNKALAADPNLLRQAPSVGYNIAMSQHHCNNLDAARTCLLAALELDPDYEPAKRLLEQLAG
jgi:tetratricopeptide (TPR) repeat protein